MAYKFFYDKLYQNDLAKDSRDIYSIHSVMFTEALWFSWAWAEAFDQNLNLSKAMYTYFSISQFKCACRSQWRNVQNCPTYISCSGLPSIHMPIMWAQCNCSDGIVVIKLVLLWWPTWDRARLLPSDGLGLVAVNPDTLSGSSMSFVHTSWAWCTL